jgi:[histone H3]-lysine4 N-trimethyltransferase ASH1L
VTADDYIGEYTGVAISEPEAERRRQEYEADKSIGFYIMSLGDNNLSGLCLYIDARGFDSPLAMINHSCSPNCRAEIWTVEGIPRVGLFANIDIASDSELSFDYRSKATGLEDGELCKCGSANCRGFF